MNRTEKIKLLKMYSKKLLSKQDLKTRLTGGRKSSAVVVHCQDRNNGPFRIGSKLTKNEQILNKEQLQAFLKTGGYHTVCYLPEKKHSH